MTLRYSTANWDGWEAGGPPVFDERDAAIRITRMEERAALRETRPYGPMVGDYAILKDGRTMRFSHDWGYDIQVSEGGSFCLCRGGVFSFSGSLDPAIRKDRFTLYPEEPWREAPCWFFHHDQPRAHHAVNTTIAVPVWHEITF